MEEKHRTPSEPTLPAGAMGGCPTCSAREAILAKAIRHGVRVTTCVQPNVHCGCSELFWTAYVVLNEGTERRTCAIGRGHTQEEAICEALRDLQVPL